MKARNWWRVGVTVLGLVFLAVWLLQTRGDFGAAGQYAISPNARPWPLVAWLLPLAVVLIFGGAAALSIYDRFRRSKTPQEQRNSTLTALLCLALTLFLWPWALLGPGDISQPAAHGGKPRLTLEGRFNIIASLWSDVATEYFGAAYRIGDARQFGSQYATKWQTPPSQFQAHIATHPPGAVLFFYGARRVYEAVPLLQNSFTSLAQTITRQKLSEMVEGANVLRVSASRGLGAGEVGTLPDSAIGCALWTALLLGMSLVLAIPAVYGLAALGDEQNGEARGLFAVFLWVLAPTVNLFAFTLDAVVAAGTVWCLYFAARGFTAKNGRAARVWTLAAGVSLALTSFVSIGALAVGAILLFTLLLKRQQMNYPILARLIELGSSFLLTWLMLALVFAFNPFVVVQKAMAAHHMATLSYRTYWPWLWLNLVMWLPFVGLPLALLCVRREPITTIGAQIGVATLATLLLLSLSGNVRGEVERLWLFLLAPLAVWASFTPTSPRQRAVLLVLQGAQTLLMAATLAPLVRP